MAVTGDAARQLLIAATTDAERSLAAALKAAGVDRKDIVLATKVLPNNLEPAKLRSTLEASLKNLGTEYIDLYQIHWVRYYLEA